MQYTIQMAVCAHTKNFWKQKGAKNARNALP